MKPDSHEDCLAFLVQEFVDLNYPPRACAKGLSNWFCPSVSLSVQSDQCSQISPVKSDLCVPHKKQSGSIPSAFPAVSYLTS